MDQVKEIASGISNETKQCGLTQNVTLKKQLVRSGQVRSR